MNELSAISYQLSVLGLIEATDHAGVLPEAND
jgi:hypothetical protein